MKKFFRRTYLLFVFIVLPFSSHAQVSGGDSLKIDSLNKVLRTEKRDTNKVNTLIKLGDIYYFDGNNTEAIKTFSVASAIAKELNDTTALADCFFYMGNNYSALLNYPEGLQCYYTALKLYEQLNDKKSMRDCYLFIGGYYSSQNNYPAALENYHSTLKISEQLADSNGISFNLRMIAHLYDEQGNYEEALNNLFASLKITEQIGDKFAAGQCYMNIADNYLSERNYPAAFKQDSIALNIIIELGDKAPFWAIATCNQGIGNIYEAQGDSDDSIGNKLKARNEYLKALEKFLITLQVWQHARSTFAIADLQEAVGEVYIKLKKFKKAKNYLDSALQTSKKRTESQRETRDTYQLLSKLDSAEGNYQQAFEHYKIYILYHDSLLNEDSKKKSVQISMQYEFDKKEAIAKAIQDKKDADAKRIRNQQYFAIASLGALVMAVLIIALIQLRNNKQKQKANKVLAATLTNLKSTQAQLIQSEKMASLGELTAGIAHEIQNPLNFVNNFSEVNTELLEEADQEIDKGNVSEVKIILNDIKENEQKINHHGKRADAIVKGMLQHSRSSTGVKEPTDINALADEYLRLAYHGLRAKDKSFNATMKTNFDESIGKINMIPQDIGRVLLNLYNNAFYAVTEKAKQQTNGYEPTISVSTKKISNVLELTVKDNGNGIPQKVTDKIFQPFFTTKPTGEGTGLGLSLAYDIIKAHGGEIKAETKENEETIFTITLPNTK